jgi:hypothetical protein
LRALPREQKPNEALIKDVIQLANKLVAELRFYEKSKNMGGASCKKAVEGTSGNMQDVEMKFHSRLAFSFHQ